MTVIKLNKKIMSAILVAYTVIRSRAEFICQVEGLKCQITVPSHNHQIFRKCVRDIGAQDSQSKSVEKH